MKLNYRYIGFLSLFLFFGSFIVQSQDADLRPAKTKMLGRSLEELEAVTITHYRYQSSSSKKEITKFYRLLFSNRGFKEMKGRRSAKNFFSFVKQEDGVMITLIFIGPDNKKLVNYNLSNHHFSLKKDKQTE